MSLTGTVLYSSGLTYAHQDIGKVGSIYILDGVTGSFPAGNYRVVSATLKVRVRNANWMTWIFRDGYEIELGRMPINGAGGDREAPLSTEYPYPNGAIKLVIYGEGSPGAQLESGTYVQIEVKWEISTTSCTPPTSVNLDKQIAESCAQLSWSGAAGGVNNAISFYQVFHRDTGDGTSWSDFAFTGQTGNSYLHVAPPGTPGHVRQFAIRVVGTAGDSFASALAHSPFLHRNVPPNAPTSLSVTPTLYESGVIQITWTAASDYDGQPVTYEVMYQVSADGTSYGALTSAGYTTNPWFNHAPNLGRGHRIKYFVKSIDSLYAASSNVYAGEVRRNRRPSEPTGLTASPAVFEGASVTLTWGASSDPDHNLQSYQAFVRYMPPGGSWGDFSPIGYIDKTATSFTHAPSVSRGGSVQYGLMAIDAMYVASDVVYSGVVTRNTLPDAPTNGSVSPGIFETGQLSVSWKASTKPGVTYGVGYSVDNGDVVDAGATNNTSLQLNVSVNRGAVVRVYVAARDSLGATSSWLLAGTAQRNMLPRPPVLMFGSGVTRCTTPCFGFRVDAEPDGQQQQVQYRVVDGDGRQVIPYTTVAHVGGSGQGLTVFRTGFLDAGSYTLYMRTVDSLGAISSSSPSVGFQIEAKQWIRSISSGDVIADVGVSHRVDIHELLNEVNTRRVWYGQAGITLEGVGYFAKWRGHMLALQNGLSALFPLCGISYAWGNVPQYPNAAVINEIRQVISLV